MNCQYCRQETALDDAPYCLTCMDRGNRFLEVFGTAEGKKVLVAIVEHSGLLYENAEREAVPMAVAVGKRNLAAWIESWVELGRRNIE